MTPSSIDEPTSITSKRAVSHAMPDVVRPMLATAAAEPFDSRDHIFELMWSGLRAMAHVRDGHMRLRARNGLDLAPFFPELRHIPGLLNAREAIVDGEVVVIDAEGHPAFDALRPRLHVMAGDRQSVGAVPPVEYLKPRKIDGQICFQAFDLIWLDGRTLTDRPLWQRKNRLHNVLRATPEFAAVDFVDDEGIAFYDAVLDRRLDGVVAKEKVSTYAPGVRSDKWLEVRALQSGDFVIGGYTFGGGQRRADPFGQLLLGAYEDGRFEYVGALSGGLGDTDARQLIAMLQPGLSDTPAFADPPRVPRLIYWTQPEIVCRVRFSEWSPDGYLRFPIFSALRPDLSPADCVLD